VPKEVLDLRNFSGGLNNNTNPRDLDTSEFQELNGLSMETPGKLKISGSVTDLPHASSANEEKFTTTLNYGNGLFHFNSDRDPNDGALSNTELLLINDVTNHKVKVFDKTDGAYESGSEIDYGTTGTTVDYYAVDGQVRVSANNQANTNNQNKWYGYINRVYHYGNDNVDVHLIKTVNGFTVDNAYPSPLKSGTHSSPDGYGYQVNQLQSYAVGNSDFLGTPNNQTELLFNRNIASWSVAANSITPSNTNKLDTVASAFNASYTGWSSGYGPLGLYMWFDPADQSTGDQANANINVYANSLNKKYSIWVTNIYDDQESNATHVGYIEQPPTLTADRKRTLYWSIIGRIPNKKRQTGFKVYWALDDDDIVGIKYLFMEIDFEKGIRQPGTDVYVKLGQTTHNNSGAISSDNEKMYATGASFSATNMQSIRGSTNIQELSILEPYIERGYNPLGRAGTWFKTSVILNRRAYIGNIRYYDENNKLQTANDTVLKSEVNKFDTFDRDKRLDVEINDGDDIIKLASVGSKLLEFKKNSLFIINCSRDQELLEATLKYKGCEKDYHVVQAEGFVAWFNKYGVFLYDGEQLRDLLIGPTGQKRFKDWNTQYFSNDGVIGYIPDKQTLIIANPAIGGLNNNPSGGVLEIDLKTLGWAYSALKLNTVDVSNFVNVNDGKLIWFEKNGNDIELKYWNPEPSLRDSNNASVVLKTAAFDFGDPSRDKTITTVYINYKNGEDITVKGFTDVAASNDGSAFSSVTLGTLAGNNDTTNRVAKFKVRGITSAFKKVKTFGLELSGATDQQDFEINDMQIVHRIKTIK
tara:strand:+ start:2486 stop:4921 length:2436 start_codon:yes stop_codon:yes gene_type:complete